MDSKIDNEAIIKGILQSEPMRHLRWNCVESGPDLEFEVPRQGGLQFDLGLSVFNDDELVFAVDAGFHGYWFPSDNLKVVQRYQDAVIGFVTGTYRILEYYRRSEMCKAFLQRPEKRGWKTVYSCNGFTLWSWGAIVHELRNNPRLGSSKSSP